MRSSRFNLKTGKRTFLVILVFLGLWLLPQNAFAHCDSYDGPVVKDALKALENNDPDLVLKWVDIKHEKEIKELFAKTIKYRTADKEIYSILKKHFLETLVRVHREGEGEPYTGLKPAGSTKQIIQLTDTALDTNDIEGLLKKFNGHVNKILTQKFEKVATLDKVKNNSVQEGRDYVAAYVDYTHTIEMMHDILEHKGGAHESH